MVLKRSTDEAQHRQVSPSLVSQAKSREVFCWPLLLPSSSCGSLDLVPSRRACMCRAVVVDWTLTPPSAYRYDPQTNFLATVPWVLLGLQSRPPSPELTEGLMSAVHLLLLQQRLHNLGSGLWKDKMKGVSEWRWPNKEDM
ncbi:hypothetical protein E2C01_012613 [Portunus trituberculatus]|uniref:Uncharacterized protein n=1 Tax=Portunus trituberculatus TaxID=210409 RepID=A0A5B7DEQ0_PORTR|nr:hypothetical protein [Portunus trituberculatus]